VRHGDVGSGRAEVKIDLHTHILPRDWPDLDARYGYAGWVRLEHDGPGCARMMIGARKFRDVSANLWDLATRLAEMDQHEVTLQVLSTVPVMFAYWAKPQDTLDLARRLNDHIAEIVARRPDRFAGLATVPLQAPDLAERELERVMRDSKLSGVQLGSHAGGRALDDPELRPFFAAAERLDAALFIHPWDMLAPERMTRHWLGWLIGMPTETALAAAALAFGGVLERHPRLRVGLAHGGGSFPWLLGRLDHGFEARPDLCQTACQKPPSRFARRYYYDALVHDPGALRFLIEQVGCDRIALGTDYPFPLGESRPGALIASLEELDSAARSRLLAETALEFLRGSSRTPTR
jgi:aminocarboxymuconate-semialdehyde decarboxylase